VTTRVVYIAGQSYSGSTFFCALLGVHPQMEPVSELAMWSRRSWEPYRTCSCGRLSSECPFWTDVRRRWFEQLNPLSLERYVDLQTRIETIAYTWPQMFSRKGWPSAEMEEYARATTSLYTSLADASGRPVIVDSSKKPGRAVAVSRMDGLDVSIIHLVRDGLSYVDSNIRRMKLSPAQPDFLYRVFRLGQKWSVANYAAERAAVMNGSKGVRLRYEDLVSEPVASLESVGAAIGLDMQPVQDHVTAGHPISYRHMESGSRHRRAGPTTLQADRAAAATLDRRARIAFYLGGGLQSRRYGYL